VSKGLDSREKIPSVNSGVLAKLMNMTEIAPPPKSDGIPVNGMSD
jgi:hypothetical protein